MKFSLFIIFILIIPSLYAQNNAEIKGSVFDSYGNPLERATVSLVSEADSLVISYALTDEKGRFDLVRVPSQKALVLFVSYINTTTFKETLTLKPAEKYHLDSIFLMGNAIGEVQITAHAPIRLNGDTLEYRADFFKTRPNASVEELLQLLPGLQVNMDGTIFYQGREVSGVRVNNKDFFVQDLKIATRNLDAVLIDIVQVIKDKGESKRDVIDDNDLPIIINFKMKREFLKANFGKLYGGAATRDRYEAGALISTFRDTLQVSFIGFANNIGRQGFDYSELNQYGGYGRAENTGMVIYGAAGLINQISAGVNVNYDIGKKLKTNLMYNFRQNNFYNDREDHSQTFYDDVKEELVGREISQNDGFTHELRGFVRYHFDTTAYISYDGRVDHRIHRNVNDGSSDRWRNAHEPVVNSTFINRDKNTGWVYRQNINMEKKFRNQWILSFRHSAMNDDRDRARKNASVNRYYLFNDSLVDQEERTHSVGSAFEMSNEVNLQLPLGETVKMDVFSGYESDQEQRREDIQNRINSDVFRNRNDIANTMGLSSESLYLGTRWNIAAIKNLPIALGMKWVDFKTRFDYYGRRKNVKTRHRYWLPEITVSYKTLNISYRREVKTPSFQYLVVVDSDLYPTRFTYASPYFDNIVTDRYYVRYHNFFTKPKISFSIGGGLTQLDMSIAQKRTYDVDNGFSTMENYQTGKVNQYYVSLNFSKTFIQNNIWRLSYALSSFGNTSQSYSHVNQEENLAVRYYGMIKNSITLSYKNNLTLSPIYEIDIRQTNFKYESPNFRNVNDLHHSFGASMLVNNIKKFRLEASYTLKNQVSGLDRQRENIHLVNASVYYPVWGKGELKLSAYDILDQNISHFFNASENTNTHLSTSALRQYFMLSLVYKFLK